MSGVEGLSWSGCFEVAIPGAPLVFGLGVACGCAGLYVLAVLWSAWRPRFEVEA